MYTKESLKKINAEYICSHYAITDYDVDMANTWVRRLEASRNPAQPMPGDIVQYITRWGDYYKHAHIERIEADGQLYICEQPYVPFVFDYDGKFYFSTSGGSWRSIPSDLEYVGTEKKYFCDWGTCGPCAHGAVDFEAEVNVWQYAEPDPFFGGFTTETWCRDHISFREETTGGGCRPYHYFGNGRAFETEADYLAWLNTYKGVEFRGFWENQTVVFFYRKAEHYISCDEWNALELPTDTRMMNGGYQFIKYRYDDEAHIIHEYRYTNSGDLDWRTHRSYEVAHRNLEMNPQRRVILERTAKQKGEK